MKREIRTTLALILIALCTIAPNGSGVDAGPVNPLDDSEHSILDDSNIYLPLTLRNYSSFSFRQALTGPLASLSLWIMDLNVTTGVVTINGVDPQPQTVPFAWDWGDGTVGDGWFPQTHTYTDRARNYVIKVTSHYTNGSTGEERVLVRFVPSTITPIDLPTTLRVTIPDHDVTLGTRLYPVPGGLTYFDDSYFAAMSREDIETVLSVVATRQFDYANGDVYLVNNGFEQVVLRDPSFAGMYSLWFTNPPSFASGDYGFQGTLQYSSFFHEMGHNITLNSPASYYYGGRIDGNANAIFSESMANIFAHATAYDILNHPTHYGFDNALSFEIEQSANASVRTMRNAYESYLSTGKVFHSWNDPSTPADETFDTFMTISYKFCTHAEDGGQGYRVPLKKMMVLLEKFNEQWKNSYDQVHDTSDAEAFRATLMVAALSYAFSADLRAEFRDLSFPISDSIYDEIMATVNP